MIGLFGRPVAFFDIEATGKDRENDRIVEICIIKIMPDGTRETKNRRINPEMPIPPGATETHGITDEMVAAEPTFTQIAKGLLQFIDGCDFAGYNSNNYDIPMLYYEFLRAGIEMPYKDRRFYDVGNLFKIQETRTLSAAVKFYLGREHEGAHGAEADVEATIQVFLAQLERYPDLPTDQDSLALYTNYGNGVVDISGKFVRNPDGVVLYNFGPKTKGNPVASDPSFLHWMISKGTFMPDTMAAAHELYEGLFNNQKD